MRSRRADSAWASLLLLSAALSLSAVPAVDDGGWLAPAMAVLAYPAGRRMTSFPLALWVFAAVTSTGLALALWRSPDPLPTWLSVVFVEFAASVLPWWAGRYGRLRAEQRERERRALVERARLRERARIARDVHDSLGHELALIALRGGALELAADLTDEQRRAAGEVRAGAVRATRRLHEVVRVLGDGDAAAQLRPADETVDDLVRRAAAAGLRVRLRRRGGVFEWSPEVGRAAHRVVQESLTNAARHAPGASVTVTLARQGAATRIDVANDAAVRPAGGAGTGQGLVGLDERVRLAGGRLEAGPRPGGGWVVSAVLPDDAGGGTAPWPGGEVPFASRPARRALSRTAALPVGGGLALLVALFAAQLPAAARTGLAADRYERLRPGAPRAEVERLLPPQDMGGTPRVVVTPPSPDGASCVYYRAGDGVLDPRPAVYQLCFADGVLVAKNRLERA